MASTGVTKESFENAQTSSKILGTFSTPQAFELRGDEQRKAAELIQKTFRGHRTRRQIQGYGLDASTRWMETVRDVEYQKLTAPRGPDGPTLPARDRWQQVAHIAGRAGVDDSSDSDDVSLSEADSNAADRAHRTREEQAEGKRRQSLANEKRKHTAKMMDLQYFLEMVDHKHRYGSNLRKYHNHWKTQNTNQNFFYWLDQGDGKNVELEECSRARLDTQQVRYLSRAERLDYLVKVDKQGKLIWAKNGEKVWTKDELYRDSIEGIVHTHDQTPVWKHNIKTEYHHDSDTDSDSEEEDETEALKGDLESEKYVNQEFHRARGPAKLKYVTPAVLFNHITRQSLKKGHKWIFVADTNFRLYIGYKQSGAFQHSSFLHGSRILAAGQIKVKDGQLRRLSPLSGHYRPRTDNFRAFVHSLEGEGVDMSHVSIPRSYAILVGLEGYVKTRKKIKRGHRSVIHQVDKLVRPEKAKADEEAAQDHSKSAEKEREHLEKARHDELERRHESKKSEQHVGTRLSTAWERLTGKSSAVENQGVGEERGTPGTGPEDGVPPPNGQ